MTRALNFTRNLFFLCFFILYSSDLQANIFYVNASISGGNHDGSSWQNAFSNLQDALNIAANGDEIWVANGTYFPTQDSNRKTFFRLLKGVKWYGGFQGSETSIAERDLDLNETILSGDIGVLGDSTDNSYSVVFTIFSDSTTVMDGFIIEEGNADNPDNNLPFYHREKCGGGMYIHGQGIGKSASPIIRNCIFRQNYALLNGGAIFSNGRFDGTSAPIIEECHFIENHSGNGAAIYQDGGSLIDYPTQILGCLFKNNKAKTEGGALYFQNTHSNHFQKIEGCTFEKNEALGGGALLINDFTEFGIKFSNCNFLGNNALSTGAVLYSESYEQGGGFHFTNCLFNENTTAFFGGDDSAVLLMAGPPGGTSIDSSEFILFDNCEFSNHDVNCILAFQMNLKILNSYFENNYECALTKARGHTRFHNTHFKENGSCVRINSDLEVNNVELNHLISNCIFENNTGYDLYFIASKLKTVSSTFVKNSDYYFAYASSSTTSYLDFYNCIFWRESAQTPITRIKYGQPVFGNCLIDVSDCSEVNNSDGVNNPPLCLAETIFGKDPLFNPDLTLQPCSPAINSGENFYTTQWSISSDIDGNPRVLGSSIDMGAFEIELDLDDLIIETESQIACWGIDNGSVQITIPNACLPVVINGMVSDSNSIFFENLAPGNYSFPIEDALNRMGTVEFQIVQENFPWSVNFEIEDYNCANAEGGSILSLPFGVDSLNYFWSNGATDPNLYNLIPGTYNVTATNENDCSYSASIEINYQNNLPLGINVTPINCHDSNNGTATTTPLSGVYPFNFEWATGETDSTLTNLSGGNYAITVTDAVGCTDELSFIMNAPDSLYLDFEIEDVKCKDQSNGLAIANPVGGTAPYSFEWNNFNQTDTLANLPPGDYSVTVIDENECETSGMISISEPSQIQPIITLQDNSCFESNDGWVSVWPFGGTPPYFYEWSNGSTDSLIVDLPVGNYEVSVSDANNCAVEISININEPNPINIESVDILHIDNPDTDFGYISIDSISGGIPPFDFLWDTGDTTSTIDSLQIGEYWLTITDANGCDKTESFLVEITISSIKNTLDLSNILYYPNPVQKGDYFNISIQDSKAQNWEVSIFDSVGKIISTIEEHNSKFEIKAPDFPGVYWVTLENEQKRRAVLKFVVL